MFLNAQFCWIICALLLQANNAITTSQAFYWNWKEAQALGVKQSLRNAQMNADDKTAIAKALEKVIQPYLSDAGEPDDQLQEEALKTRVKQVDLNGDGVPEVIAQAMVGCGASGNCPFWIFQKQSDGYKLLLDDSAETFTIQKTRTNGYSDIVLALHDSEFEQTLDVYHYANGEYKGTTGCYTAIVAVMKDDGIHELAEPRVTPCKKE